MDHETRDILFMLDRVAGLLERVRQELESQTGFLLAVHRWDCSALN